MFEVSTCLDNTIIQPIAEMYRDIVSPLVRDRIRSALDNLTEPRIFVNDLLQVRVDAARMALARFLVDTTARLTSGFGLTTPTGPPEAVRRFRGDPLHLDVTDGSFAYYSSPAHRTFAMPLA